MSGTATPLRLGTILLITLLLAAAAYVARTPLSGEAAASGDLGPSVGELASASPFVVPESESPSPSPSVAPASPEVSSAPTSGPSPGQSERNGPSPVEARIELIETCLLPEEWTPPTAQALFEISWVSEVPLAQIALALDGVTWSWYGGERGTYSDYPGPLPASDTIRHYDYPTVGEPHVLTASFYEEIGEPTRGPMVQQVSATVDVDPSNPCYPDSESPPPTEPPGPSPATSGVPAS